MFFKIVTVLHKLSAQTPFKIGSDSKERQKPAQLYYSFPPFFSQKCARFIP